MTSFSSPQAYLANLVYNEVRKYLGLADDLHADDYLTIDAVTDEVSHQKFKNDDPFDTLCYLTC